MLGRLLVSSHGEMTFTRRGANSTVVNIDIGGRGTSWRLVVAIYLPPTVKKLLSAMSLSGLHIGALPARSPGRPPARPPACPAARRPPGPPPARPPARPLDRLPVGFGLPIGDLLAIYWRSLLAI